MLTIKHCRSLCQLLNRVIESSTRHSSIVSKLDPYCNPVWNLQEFLEVPVLNAEDHVFKPSTDEIKQSTLCFNHSRERNHRIELISKVVSLERLPDTAVPEVAFIGRSNVGKSSLIRKLFESSLSANKLDTYISVSKKPGHTRNMRFFKAGNAFTLVDMPGYGFNMPHHYRESVIGYISSRKQLCRVFLLLDGNTGMTQDDHSAIELLESIGKPYVLILTKIDKATPSGILKNFLIIQKTRQENAPSCLPQPFLVSSVTGSGIAYLQCFIAYLTGNVKLQGH